MGSLRATAGGRGRQGLHSCCLKAPWWTSVLQEQTLCTPTPGAGPLWSCYGAHSRGQPREDTAPWDLPAVSLQAEPEDTCLRVLLHLCVRSLSSRSSSVKWGLGRCHAFQVLGGLG